MCHTCTQELWQNDICINLTFVLDVLRTLQRLIYRTFGPFRTMQSSALRMARASLLLRGPVGRLPPRNRRSGRPVQRAEQCLLTAYTTPTPNVRGTVTFYDSTWSWCRTVWGGAGCLSKTKQITGAEQRSPSFSLFGIISWSLWMRRRFKCACCRWNPTPQTKQRPCIWWPSRRKGSL